MSTYRAGQWNAICDRCGLEFKSSKLKKDWQGLMVDEKCHEQRHPQDLIRTHTDTSATPWARPEGDDVFIAACFIWGESAYADLGSSDCMKADNTTFSYATLLELKGA